MAGPGRRDPRVDHRDRAGRRRDRDHILRRGRGCVAPGAPMSESRYVHALALGLDPAWRRLIRDERCRTADEFAAAATARSEVTTFASSMIGLKAGVEVLLRSLSPSLHALHERSSAGLAAATGPT